jgi:hypothetical protein
MLRANLSTRPFYNERAVQIILGVIVLVMLAVTAFNVAQLVRLTASQRTLGAHAVESEREAARPASRAIRAQINVGPRGRRNCPEANGIIDQRAPERAFDQLEQTLPDDVRITAVDPGLGRGVRDPHQRAGAAIGRRRCSSSR